MPTSDTRVGLIVKAVAVSDTKGRAGLKDRYIVVPSGSLYGGRGYVRTELSWTVCVVKAAPVNSGGELVTIILKVYVEVRVPSESCPYIMVVPTAPKMEGLIVYVGEVKVIQGGRLVGPGMNVVTVIGNP